MASTPGVTVASGAGSANPTTAAPTAAWFTVGVANGPSGMAVPIASMSDFQTYFGQIVNGVLTGRYSGANLDSTLLYDALDVFFREGGVTAWVSRMVPASSGAQAASTGIGTAVFAAAGKGAWANSSNAGNPGLIITTAASTVNGNTVYTVTIVCNGVTLAASPYLGSATDIINWINSLPAYQSMCVASVGSQTTALPTTGNSTSVYFTGGTDAAVADSDMTAALAVYTEAFGPGQVSYPGSTSGTAYATLAIHAKTFNRVAIVDGANTATASTLTTAVQTLQTAAGVDPSYVGMFAPWLTVPGISNINPAGTSPLVFNRTVPPCGAVAAKMALIDSIGDSNNAAAGVGDGTLKYAIAVSQSYDAATRATLNGGGVNVIKLVPNVGVIAIYGFRSCSFDPSWQSLAHVRFRMQVVRDLDIIAESVLYGEIDGRGQIFAKLAGALQGQLQQYFQRGSLYGTNPGDSFIVNTSSPVNTVASIALGQVNAQVALRMSPMAEFVTINISKYSAATPLPVVSNI